MDIKQIPNILTWIRIASIPVLLYILSLDSTNGNWICLFLYILSAITDYFDGYIARRYKASTTIGMFLDPLADKLLVLATLTVLLFLHRVNLILVIISLIRELSVQGLRTLAAEQSIKIPSTQGGKIKTSFQMTAIGFLIASYSLDPIIQPLLPFSYSTNVFGNILLSISLMFSLFSALDYLVNFNKKGRWS